MRLLSGNPVGYLARNPAQRRGSHLSCDILINRLSPDDKRAADRPIVLILVYDLLQPLLVEFQEVIQIYRFDKIDVRENSVRVGLYGGVSATSQFPSSIALSSTSFLEGCHLDSHQRSTPRLSTSIL